jgi:hypothetical protein
MRTSIASCKACRVSLQIKLHSSQKLTKQENIYQRIIKMSSKGKALEWNVHVHTIIIKMV